jgi:hypothetical protein
MASTCLMSVPGCHATAFYWTKRGACSTRAESARDASEDAERETKMDKRGTHGLMRLAAWIFIIFMFWTQLFHCK